MTKKVLITGGSGMIGSALTQKLILKGYKVAHLGRKNKGLTNVENYQWDVQNNELDERALHNTSFIIHLAGAGVFDKPWSLSYKKEIIESRVKSAELLLQNLRNISFSPEAFISASGVAFYGADTKDIAVTEQTPAGQGFLAQVVKEWEKAADEFKNNGIRTVKLRTGIVLDKKGGALKELTGPIRFGAGSPLGTGHQYIPWIHIDDLCEMYIYAMENNSIHGVLNAVSPFPVMNKEFIKEAARILKKPLVLPNVPAFILKIYLGAERAAYILGGNRIITPKIETEGFKFKYPVLFPALSELLLS